MTLPPGLTGMVIAALAAIALARLLLGLWRLPPPQRPRPWRSLLLVAGTVASAALLWLLLREPPLQDTVRALHVATAGASERAPPVGDALRIVLPEATGLGDADGQAMPDLASALRRHPRVRRLVIEGHGLEARDRDVARGLAITFAPPPLPHGIVSLWAPSRVQAGQSLQVHAGVLAPEGARVELLDPGGKAVDTQPVQDDGGIALSADVRSAGLAVYTLRLSDARDSVIDQLPVAVEVLAPASAKVALRAGGPDPELKFLRRWAADHGASLQASIALGMGLQAGDPPLPLDAASLAGIDLLVLDDRSWNSLGGGQRAAVLGAVSRGMGLLLRPGAALAGGGLGIGVASAPAAQARPALAGIEPARLPRLQLPALRIVNPQGVTTLRDERGQPLAAWRAHGRGRIGIWLPQDSFQLALSRRSDLHARMWDAALQPLLRARLPTLPRLPGDARAAEATQLCGLQDGAVAIAADGGRRRLAIDPRSGGHRCAAFWPDAGGWHRVAMGDAQHPFHVLPADAGTTLHLASLQQATRALAATGATPPPATAESATHAGTPGTWPLFALWLALSVALWWFERSRYGRR